jgi:hypothetical protein
MHILNCNRAIAIAACRNLAIFLIVSMGAEQRVRTPIGASKNYQYILFNCPILVQAVCMCCHGTKCPLLTAFFHSLLYLLFSHKGRFSPNVTVTSVTTPYNRLAAELQNSKSNACEKNNANIGSGFCTLTHTIMKPICTKIVSQSNFNVFQIEGLGFFLSQNLKIIMGKDQL